MKKNRAFIDYLLAVFLMVSLSACSNNKKQYVASDGTKFDLQEIAVPKPLRGCTVMVEISGLGSNFSASLHEAIFQITEKAIEKITISYYLDDGLYVVKLMEMPDRISIPVGADVHYVFLSEERAALVKTDSDDMRLERLVQPVPHKEWRAFFGEL